MRQASAALAARCELLRMIVVQLMLQIPDRKRLNVARLNFWANVGTHGTPPSASP